MDANELQARLMKFATDDIELVERTGMITVTGTKKGNVIAEVNNEVYTLKSEGNINWLTAERDMELLYEGAKEGAILYLAGLYDVVG